MTIQELEVVDFEPALAGRFRDLNLEWIEGLFTVEAPDQSILGDPQRHIIEPGGAILFARVDCEIVGTGALLPAANHAGYFELVKMAVTAHYRGRGIGARLLTALLARFKQLGGIQLQLETSSKLPTAIRLYAAHGFKPVARPVGGTEYTRADVFMVYDPAGS